MNGLLSALAVVHILITTCGSAGTLPFVMDTMLLMDVAMAPVRGVGGTVYTIVRRSKSTSLCVLSHRDALHPITFADFDMQFGLLYKMHGSESSDPEASELQPIAVLDALQGCYVDYRDRSTQRKPPCFAFLNSTSDECLRGERESLFFTVVPAAVEMLATYIVHYLPQRANMRQMIARSVSFEVDIRQAALHLAKNKVELSSSEYGEVVFRMQNQVEALFWKHRVVVNDKWKLLQSWLNTTTGSSCSAVDVLPQWLSRPREVTVENIVGLVRHTLSTLFKSEDKYNKDERVLLMERSFCAVASFAIAAIFLEDLNFLQMDDDPRHTATLGILEAENEMPVDKNLEHLKHVVKEEWNKLQSIANPFFWSCLGGIFVTDTPTIPSIATCFTEEVTETRWSFLTSEHSLTASIVGNTSHAQRVQYLFAWLLSKPIRFDTVQKKGSTIQTGFMDIPLDGKQVPSFPEGVVGGVAKKHPSNGSQPCPAGTFALIEDTFYCMDCVNEKDSFVYCPGDGMIHSCTNKPDGTAYVPTGLKPSSSASCRFHCIDPYMFQLNGICDFVPGYYMSQDSLVKCAVPDTFIGPLLLPFYSVVGGGAPNIVESCSYVLRRRVISEQISQLPSPLQWCGSSAMGFSMRLSTKVSGEIIRQHHTENYGDAYPQRITAIAYELVAIIPNGWSWYLISYFDPTPSSPLSNITMQLSWNASFSSDLFSSVNWTLYESCPTCALEEEEVQLNLTLSWDPTLEEVVFFVNDIILGTPISHHGVKKFLTRKCTERPTHLQMAVGGWKAAYKWQVEFLGRISSSKLPRCFEYFPGEVEELSLRSRSLSLLHLPSKGMFIAAPADSSFAAGIFATATSMVDLALITFNLQQESRHQYLLPGRICRFSTQRHLDGWNCSPCPVGSYGLLPDEMSGNKDAFCKCITTRHMTSNLVGCTPRRVGYGAPVSIRMTDTSRLFIPFINSTLSVPLARFVVDEFTRPPHAVDLSHPKAVASVDCDPGLSFFTISNSPDDSTVEVLLSLSLGVYGERCTISGSVQMDPFLESPQSRQLFQFNFRASPLVSNNLNVNFPTTLAKDQCFIWLRVTGYSLLQLNGADALQFLELGGNQFSALRESLRQTLVHVYLQCDPDWSVSRVLSLDDGVLLPVQEGHSCTLNLTVASSMAAFSPSIPLIIAVDSCVDGRSEVHMLLNSHLVTIIMLVTFFITALLSSLLYGYFALQNVHNSNKASITHTSNGGAE